MTARFMTLVGYLMVPTGHFTGSWRHPATDPHILDAAFHVDVARTLERGLFDMVFLPDVLAVPDGHRDGYGSTLSHGGQGALQLDPTVVAATMAAATRHIGLGVTMSTTFMPPFHIARLLGTLDHLSGGRAAWNIVTSAQAAQAANFGGGPLPPPQVRYDLGDGVVETVVDLWHSWEPNALELNRQTGRFADPAKVHRIAPEGAPVRGPLTLPPSPQGHPVLMQAGASDRGRTFGARWGELVFAIQPRPEDLRALRADLRARAEAAGRDPDSVRLLAAVQPVLGETQQIAQLRVAAMGDLVEYEAAAAMLSAHTGLDLSVFLPSTSLTEVIAAMGEPGQRGSAGLLAAALAGGVCTLGEAVIGYGTNQLTPQLVGTGPQIADQLEELFLSEAADGFVITPVSYPTAFDEFVRAVVPELQRRGLFRTAYQPGTLRDQLGVTSVARER